MIDHHRAQYNDRTMNRRNNDRHTLRMRDENWCEYQDQKRSNPHLLSWWTHTITHFSQYTFLHLLIQKTRLGYINWGTSSAQFTHFWTSLNETVHNTLKSAVLNFNRERVNECHCFNQSDIMTLTCCYNINRKEPEDQMKGMNPVQPGARTHWAVQKLPALRRRESVPAL